MLLHDAYLQPWAVALPGHDDLAAMLALASKNVAMLFHMAHRGRFLLEVAGGEPLFIDEGEFVICSGGAAHRISLGGGKDSTPLDIALEGNHPARTDELSGADSELICGMFVLHNTQLNPLVAALPDVLHGSMRGADEFTILPQVTDMLLRELGKAETSGDYTINRLLELFFGDAIRRYMSGEGAKHRGWFRGLADAKICAAMTQVHQYPAKPWSVASLAAHVSMSPSRFAARFREATGQSVIAYLSEWRMHVATNLMQDDANPLSEIAQQVGYDSVSAFSRAFKRIVGVPPSRWKATDGSPRRA